MSNRSRPSPSSNPFARGPPPAAENPFASDDDEVLDEDEDEADVMARESVRMVQERLKAEQKRGGGAAANSKGKPVKHTAPSFSDDEEDEGDEEVVDDDEEVDEDEGKHKQKWVPDASSPFARNVPTAGKAAAAKNNPKPAKASKAAASNPFAAERSKSKTKSGGGGGGASKAKSGGMKEAAADTNPFADPEPTPPKKADSRTTSAPSSATSSPSSASKDMKAETKPAASTATSFLKRAAGAVGAAAVAAKTMTAQARQTKEASAAASTSATASPAAAAVSAPPSHKRQESNPFDEMDDHPVAAAAAPVAAKAKGAASTLVAPATSTSSTVKPSVSPTPSPVTHPVSPPARSAVSATPTASSATSASRSAAAAPQSPPSLNIDSDAGDSDLSSLALPATSPPDPSLASPTSVKREAAFQQRLKAAVGAGTKVQLSAFKESWDAKQWTSELTQPLFALIREKYPVDDTEERKQVEEDDEDDSDDDDEAGDEDDGVSQAERQAKRRQAQLKREGAGPRLQRRQFDPTPFNTLFSTSLTRLNTLRDSLDASIATANSTTQKAEAEHTKRMATFTTSLVSLTTRFGQLDSRISSVSHTAVRIGSSLESINASKVNTVKTLDLLTHFIAFNLGSADTLAPLFTSQKLNDMYEAASVLQLLESVSGEVRLAGVEKAVALIAKTSEECESRLLERFEAALERNRVDEMGSLARVLLGFKGKSVIKRYVFAAIQQIDRNRKRAAEEDDVEGEGEDDDEDDDERQDDDDGANEVAFIPSRRMTEDAPASPAVSAFRASLRIFCRIILTTVRQQCKTCAAVFPQPASIVRAIVERVYSDQVTEFIDSAVGRGVSAEEELLMLASALHQTEKLTQHLQQVIKTVAANTFGGAVSSASSSSVSAMDVAALTDVMNGVFQKYRDAYIGKETAYLRSRCVGVVNDTLASQPANDSITSSLKDTASSAATDYLGLTKRAPTLTNRQRWLTDTLDSEVVDELLKAMLVSVKRCDALSEPQTVADNQFALFSVVLSALVDDFLQPLLSMVAQFLPSADPKAEPDSFIFVCVRLASSVAYRIRQHYVTFIQPRLSAAAATAGVSSQNTQAVSEQRLTESLYAIEQQLLSFLSRVLTAQLRSIQKILGRQKATDYKPKDEESLFSGKPTATATAIVDSLHAAYSAAINNLEGRNLDRYLTVLGLRVWECVVEQLQRMAVSEMGAGLLSRDCKEYEAVVQEWHVRDVVERFGVLRSVSNLFFVSVDNLSAWVEQESRVRGMARDELMRFVRMRADYSQHKTKINAVLLGE